MSQHPTKTYLGNGVYCTCDGYAFVLTTENGIAITNTIVLEPAVYLALVAFVNTLVRHADTQRSA